MRIKINAIDTLFFRDAKPFNLGEESWANSIFPPSPSTIKGMLAGAYMLQKKLKPSEAYKKSQTIKIKKVFLEIENEFYYPIPADLYSVNKDDKEASAFDLIDNQLRSSIATKYLLQYAGEKKLLEISGKAILSHAELNNYLNGAVHNLKYKFLEEYITAEPKIGIGRDYNMQMTKEGQLYRVNMIRPSNKKNLNERPKVEIVVDADLPVDFIEKGCVKLGGEGKVVSFVVSDEITNIPVVPISGNRFRLYLATPAVFENGWLPKWLHEDGSNGNLTVNDKKIPVRLLATASGKRKRIGGFDAQLGIPKPMHSFVSEGSVFYLETDTNEQANTIANALHNTCISEMSKAEDGFGLAYIGNLSSNSITS